MGRGGRLPSRAPRTPDAGFAELASAVDKVAHRLRARADRQERHRAARMIEDDRESCRRLASELDELVTKAMTARGDRTELLRRSLTVWAESYVVAAIVTVFNSREPFRIAVRGVSNILGVTSPA